MEVVVQKFGGTSVSTKENRLKCLKHIKREINDGKSVVVVVSALGRFGDPYATDTLLSLVNEEGCYLEDREKDLLLSTGEIISATCLSSLLNAEKIKNIVLTGGQAGIITNETFGNSLIVNVETKRLREELKKGKVVIVPGFQGVSISNEITTLGRGGSDTTAAALGVGLKAEFVDIYTDVEGIMTADPKLVKEAKKISSITYQDVSQMALLGSKVVHPRAVELAMKYNINLRVRSTFLDTVGTIIQNKSENLIGFNETETFLSGIVSTNDFVRFEVNKKSNEVSNFEDIFNLIEKECISLDFIFVSLEKVFFTVEKKNKIKIERTLKELKYCFNSSEKYAKICVIGAAMNGVHGVMSKIIRVLTKNNIAVVQTTDSNTTIWLMVEKKNEEKALRVLHDLFFK